MTCQAPNNNFKQCFDRYKKRYREANGKYDAVFRVVLPQSSATSTPGDVPFQVDSGGASSSSVPISTSGDRNNNMPSWVQDGGGAELRRPVPSISNDDDELDAVLEMHEEAMRFESNLAAMQSTRPNVNTYNSSTNWKNKQNENVKIVESTPFLPRNQRNDALPVLTPASDQTPNTIELSDSSPIRPVRNTARKRPFVIEDDDDESGGTMTELSIKPSTRTSTSSSVPHKALVCFCITSHCTLLTKLLI